MILGCTRCGSLTEIKGLSRKGVHFACCAICGNKDLEIGVDTTGKGIKFGGNK